MRFSIILLSTVLCWRLEAQTSYSLRECIDFTLENHPSIAIYENNNEIAKKQTTQSIAGYLPQVNGSANFTDNLKLQTTVLPAGAFGPTPTEVQLGTKYNSNMGLELSQTIYDQSKIAGIKASKPYEQMTQLQKQQNKEVLIFNTAKAYFQVLVFQEQLAALRSNRINYEELLETMEFQQAEGLVMDKDVNRIQVNLNATIYQIEDLERSYLFALNDLKNSMGMPLEEGLELRNEMDYESFSLLKADDPLVLEQLTAFKINEQQIELQEVSLQMQKAKYVPTLNFVGKYAYQSLSNDFNTAFDTWNDFSYIGLALRVPIFSGLARSSKVKEERLRLDNERSSFLLNQRNLKLNYQNASNSMETAYGSYKSSQDNLNLSKEILEVTSQQYSEGSVSLIDYLNDDMAFKNAQSNYINSLYKLMISQLNYQKAQGTLLEFMTTLK